jgi:hypothetical protein
MAITCPACGADNPADVEFCETCGYELGTFTESTAQIPTDATPQPISITEPSAPPIVIDPIPAAETTVISTPNPSYAAPQPNPPLSSGVTTARLVAKHPGAPIPEFMLDGNPAIIGRFDPESGPVDVDLDGFPGDDTISRNHAEIYYQSGQWRVQDLGSTNGVFIKQAGQTRFSARITYPENLNPNDEVALGKIRFIFQSP